MMAYAKTYSDTFRVYIVRSGYVMAKTNSMAGFWEWMFPSHTVNVSNFVSAVLSIVEETGPSRLIENPELIKRGRAVGTK